MIAKKKYGQHFLINKGVTAKISDAVIQMKAFSNNFIEIGPGKGVLTEKLLENDINLKVLEIDPDMVNVLHDTLPNLDKNDIINVDVLKHDFNTLFNDEKFNICGNYPYNISSQILFKAYRHRDRVQSIVGMFQREMAERVISPHGSKTYGILSVLMQAFYKPKMLFHVSKGSFSPPPNVQSAVISLIRNEVDTLPCDEKLFKTVVKLSFNHRRKMIRNSLKTLIKDETILHDKRFTFRPEQISVSDYIDITKIIQKQKA